MVADSTGLLPYKSFATVFPVPIGILASWVSLSTPMFICLIASLVSASGAGLLSTPGSFAILVFMNVVEPLGTLKID